jgi:hypothetical protein
MGHLQPTEVLNRQRRVGKRKPDQAGEAVVAVVVVQAFAAARFPRGHGPMRNARAGASGWSRQPAALLPADKRAEGAMEHEQAGAVESPGSLLSNRSVPGLHGLHGLCARFARFMPGLHGLFSGCKRRGTPTRRKRVEQERPLLWTDSCSLLLPCPLVLPPSQHPNKRGPMAPPLGD